MIDKDKEEIIKKKSLVTEITINYKFIDYACHLHKYIRYSKTQPVIHDVGDVKNAVSF